MWCEIDALQGSVRLKSPLLWTALFAGLSLFRIFFHEMWRDEMNIWVAAMDSSSLADLTQNLRYGGHGLLWPVSVYLVAQLAPHPPAMQCLHVAIATAGVWFLFRFSPFSCWATLLFGFSYYLCFEYAVISRHYVWEVLCLLATLACLTGRRPRYAPAALGLALLMQTTVYGLILAVAMIAAWCVALWRTSSLRDTGIRDRIVLGLATVLLMVSLATAVVWLRPPADSGFLTPWYWTFDIGRAVSTIGTLWRAFVPVPTPGLHFWNSNMLDSFPLLACILGLVIAALAFQQFRSSPKALTCWTVGAGGLLLFTYVKYLGCQRHHGHLFLAFLAASWLMAADRNRRARADGGPAQGVGRSCGWIYAVLIVQLLVGVYASIMDLAHPFSASQAAAAYIRDNRLDGSLIVADYDYAAVPVVGRLDRPRVYYPRSERTQRLVIWDELRTRTFTQQDFMHAVVALRRRSTVPVLVLTSYPLTYVPAFLEPAAHFEAGIVEDEGYDLYHLAVKGIAR